MQSNFFMSSWLTNPPLLRSIKDFECGFFIVNAPPTPKKNETTICLNKNKFLPNFKHCESYLNQ